MTTERALTAFILAGLGVVAGYIGGQCMAMNALGGPGEYLRLLGQKAAKHDGDGS